MPQSGAAGNFPGTGTPPAGGLPEVGKRGPDASNGARQRKGNLLGAEGLARLDDAASSPAGGIPRLALAPVVRSRP